MNQATLWNGAGEIVVNTRVSAAAAIAPLKESMLRQVYELVVAAGEHGATDHEISAALRMLGDTARARRHELVDAGVFAASTRTRPSPSGHPMTVWIATGKPLD
jgi:hypothetical protein